MFVLLRPQTHSTFVPNYVRRLRQFIHKLGPTKYSYIITKRIPFIKKSLGSRSFKSSPVIYSNCDFGGPCACSKCMQAQIKPICESAEFVQPSISLIGTLTIGKARGPTGLLHSVSSTGRSMKRLKERKKRKRKRSRLRRRQEWIA